MGMVSCTIAHYLAQSLTHWYTRVSKPDSGQMLLWGSSEVQQRKLTFWSSLLVDCLQMALHSASFSNNGLRGFSLSRRHSPSVSERHYLALHMISWKSSVPFSDLECCNRTNCHVPFALSNMDSGNIKAPLRHPHTRLSQVFSKSLSLLRGMVALTKGRSTAPAKTVGASALETVRKVNHAECV